MAYGGVSLDDGRDPRSLVYETRSGGPSLSEQQIEFRLQVGGAVKDASRISDAESRRRLFQRLERVANSALTGEGNDIRAAQIEFDELRQAIASALVVDRNKLLNDIMVGSLPIIVAGGALLVLYGSLFLAGLWEGLLLLLPPPNEVGIGIEDATRFRSAVGALGFSFLGLYLGLVLSSMIRARGGNGAEALAALHFHGFGVRLYNVYMSVLLIVFVILLGFNILLIGVAGLVLNDFLKMPVLGILVGAVCATGEASISRMIVGTLESPDRRSSENGR